MNDPAVSRIAELVQGITAADSSAHGLKALLEATILAVPRAALFLVSQGKIQGWGSVGYRSDVAGAQRSFLASSDQGWLGALVRNAAGKLTPRPTEDCDPDFGQLPADEMVGGTLCIDDRPVAILIGERASGETPWSPEALEMFASVAQLRLEIHLVRRKMDRLPVSADAADSSPDSGSETPRSAPAEAPDLSRARRYAKLVATDIRLYNEEAVMLGRRNGDLSERIAEPLGRGKNTFLQRHGDLGADGIQLLHEAYVQVLAAGDPALLPASLLD
jgi:hypothetical protein